MRAFFVLAAMVALVGLPRANANVEIRIINTGFGDTGWIVCADPACATAGLITVGNYTLTSESAVKQNGINPLLDMTYRATASVANAGQLIFESIATGYTIGTPSIEVIAAGNEINGVGTQSLQTYVGPAPGNTGCPA